MNGHRRHHARPAVDPDAGPFPGTPDKWAPGARHGAGMERPSDFDLDAALEDWSREAAGDDVSPADPVAAVAASADRALASIEELRRELDVAGAFAGRAAAHETGSTHHPELASVLQSAQLFAERAAATAEEQAHRALALGGEMDRLYRALELFARRNDEVVRELRRLSHTLTAHTPSTTGA